MTKFITVLERVKAVFVRDGEREFAELRPRDQRIIFDIIRAGADDVMTDGDKDGISATYYFNGHPDVRVVFFAYGEYTDEDEVRVGLRRMYVDDAQRSDTLSAIDELLGKLRNRSIHSVINLTPHDVVIVEDNGNETARFPASGEVARVSQGAVELPPVAGVPAVKTEYGDIVGLPEPAPNTVYLVSIVVVQALKESREDVYVPDTGPASVKRDTDGKIIGVRRLMRL